MSNYLPDPKVYSVREKLLWAAKHSGWSFDIPIADIAEACSCGEAAIRMTIKAGIDEGWIIPDDNAGTLTFISSNIPAEKVRVAPVREDTIAQAVYTFFEEFHWRTPFNCKEIATDINRTYALVSRTLKNAIDDGYLLYDKNALYTYILDPETTVDDLSSRARS